MSERFTDFGNKIPGIIDKEILKIGLKTEVMAQRLVPKRTWRLHNSIYTKPTGPMSVFVGTDVFYGPYVEYGTFRMVPRPYLRPAAQAAIQGAGRQIATAIINTFRK